MKRIIGVAAGLALAATVHTAGVQAATWLVPYFPGAITGSVSGSMRIVNLSASSTTVTIKGRDQAGAAGAHPFVSNTIPAHGSIRITTGQLESGGEKGTTNGLGDGSGVWSLTVEATQDVRIVPFLGNGAAANPLPVEEVRPWGDVPIPTPVLFSAPECGTTHNQTVELDIHDEWNAREFAEHRVDVRMGATWESGAPVTVVSKSRLNNRTLVELPASVFSSASNVLWFRWYDLRYSRASAADRLYSVLCLPPETSGERQAAEAEDEREG